MDRALGSLIANEGSLVDVSRPSCVCVRSGSQSLRKAVLVVFKSLSIVISKCILVYFNYTCFRILRV